jgi:hypothetical protein
MKFIEKYGIIDQSSPYHKNHIYLKTELPTKLINLIEEKGFEKIYKYFYKQKKFLVDRNIDNIILVNFFPGSGGNFLINCLSLSDDILNLKYSTITEKYNYISQMYNYINSLKSSWHDVSIAPEFTRENFYSFKSKESKYIFHLSHPFVGSNINQLFKFWIKTDKVIIFKNSLLFRGLRRFFYPNFKNNVEKSSFHRKIKILKKYRIDLTNYYNLPFKIKTELQKKLNDKKNNYSHCRLKDKKQIYFWDVNWFLSEEEFIFNIKILYDALELNGFNQDILILCYQKWINCLKLLSEY